MENKWIDVTDSLPAEGVEVLCWAPWMGTSKKIGFLSSGKFIDQSAEPMKGVLYWTPLIESPNH